MSLLDIDRQAQQRPPAGIYTFPLLDSIWADLTPEEKDVMRRWMFNPGGTRGGWELSDEEVATRLAAAGYKVSPSTITKARRRGWEPA